MQFFTAILGLSLIVFGIGIIIDPIFFDSKHMYTFDFTGFEWPFGGFLAILGMAFLMTSLRNYYYETGGDYDFVKICPKCKKPYDINELSAFICPTCLVALEEIKGFYERHPELKD